MESNKNIENKPANNNNIETKIPSKPTNPSRQININNAYDELKIGNKNMDIKINNNINNNNIPTVERIKVNITEKNQESDTSFINDNLTSKFLIKIYGILLFQFIIIFGIVLIFQIKSISSYIKTHPVLYWSIYVISFLAFFIIFILFLINPENLNKVPTNYFILFIMTIFLGLFCGVIASLYKYELVICAITCVIAISFGSFCVGAFIKTKKLKFWYLFVPSVVCIIIHYVIMILIFKKYYLYFFYCSLVAFVYALFIAFDTIIIKETYSVDEYILGALALTFDIVKLFLIILEYFGQSD